MVSLVPMQQNLYGVGDSPRFDLDLPGRNQVLAVKDTSTLIYGVNFRSGVRVSTSI